VSGRLVLALAVAVPLLLQQHPAFRSGVDVVRVDVSVTHGGAPVQGLRAENFQLTDNGVAQKVESVSLESVPLSVMLVLDTSGSVAGEELAHLIEAGQQLVRALRPDDHAGLITFSERVLVNVPLMSDHASVDRALARLGGLGATSMNDAIHVAMSLRSTDVSRPVIIVFSDGNDNLSWESAASLVEEAKKVAVVIHAIELRVGESPTGMRAIPNAGRPISPTLLSQDFVNGTPVLQALTLQAGGRVWSAKSPRDLKPLFTQALEEMRARYLLTYSPNDPPKEGYHTLKVTLKNARGDVTARPGYFVGAPPSAVR
jgi:Ca-activated chloride channel family protein